MVRAVLNIYIAQWWQSKSCRDETACSVANSLQLVELQSVALQMVLDSAWCANNDVDTPSQCTFLWWIRTATIQAQRAELVCFADPLKVSMHLQIMSQTQD